MKKINCSADLKRLRVLIVDDDVDCCHILRFALELYGMEVYTVSSVRQALKALMELQPDVLISDIAMPDEDGYSLIRKVRRSKGEISSIPAIAVTALAENIYDALSSGFHGLLQKPLDVDELVATIAGLVKQSQLVVQV